MKTKEIDVYVSDQFLSDLDPEGVCLYREKGNEPDLIKAKLIIEAPEKKIEITESDIYNAFKVTGVGYTSSLTLVVDELFRDKK